MPTSIDTTYSLSFQEAAARLENIVTRTPLALHSNLSRKYGASIFLKREDLQLVRSYKLRGAYNMISQLSAEQLAKGMVCASAGNHAQGFAFSCRKLSVSGVVFMPIITPRQKINQVKMFGQDCIEIRLVGDSYDECAMAAEEFAINQEMTIIPAFDHPLIIEGQGTVGVEILEDFPSPPSGAGGADFIFIPVGGGGLCAGVGSYFKTYSPRTKIIGVEPEGAPSMFKALKAGHPVTLENIDRFVDGAAVKRVGNTSFSICKDLLDDMLLVPEGRICSTILTLYNEDAIVVEPAGAMSIAALDQYANEIKGKKVVCIVSGSNNDIDRMQEIKERSLQYEGLKHYFLISFTQRPGALKEFVSTILGPTDDITRFEYMQKTNKENGPALVGIELQSRGDYERLIRKLNKSAINFSEINRNDSLFGYLI